MPDEDPWTDELGFTDLGTDERERNREEVKRIIRTLGEAHPELFDSWNVEPSDYRRELRSAIFSLGGTFREEHGTESEDVVRDVFLEPAAGRGRLSFTDQRGAERIDFKGRLEESGDRFAMDVKGGEGQSMGHLLVPDNTDVLVVWSERKARNTKSPSSRLNEVINRPVRWAVNHSEDLGYMVVRDPPGGARTTAGEVIPDVVVFPERFPDPANPSPALPPLDDLRFAEILFEATIGTGDLEDEQCLKHIWWHELRYEDREGARVEKDIYNAYDSSIRLGTRAIDFSRISDVE